MPGPAPRSEPTSPPGLGPGPSAYEDFIVGLPGRTERSRRARKHRQRRAPDAFEERDRHDTGKFKLVPYKDGSLRYSGRGFTAIITKFGDVIFRERSTSFGRVYGIVTEMDLSELLDATGAMDLDRYQKRAFMKATQSLRSALQEQALEDRLEDTARSVRARVRSLWLREIPSAEKRRILFQLWDECIEDHPDPKRMRASRAARLVIVDFIRRNLPQASPDAFSSAELAELNRSRTSREPFAPYP